MADENTSPKSAVLCPEAPVIGRVTHNSIQMAWVPPDPARRRSSSVTFMNLLFQTTSPHRRTDMTFCVEQKNLDCREEGYKKVYEGSSCHRVFTGLTPLTKYSYRVRYFKNIDVSHWSPDVTVKTKGRSEYFHESVQTENTNAVESFIKEQLVRGREYLNMPDGFGSTPLITASRLGLIKMVDFLLKLGANVEHPDINGKTCLMEACFSGQNDVVHLIRLATDASWLTEDKFGRTSLDWAISGSNRVMVEMILEDGYPVDYVSKRDTSNQTALHHLVATNGCVSVAEVLLKHKAAVDRRDSNGCTMLMLACFSRNVEMIKLLLKYGANVLDRDKAGKDVLQMAKARECDLPQDQRHMTIVLNEAKVRAYRKLLMLSSPTSSSTLQPKEK